MVLSVLRDRVYGDFLMPSRLDSYRALLRRALDAGYRVTSIERFWHLIVDGAVDPAERYLILRHDIDTDPETAAAMWQIECDLGIEGSYFFRLSTVDPGLMRAIAESGGEASYHYEELATIAKERHLHRAEDVRAHMPEARDRFRENLARLRSATDLPMRVVVSHGDFVNRALGVANRELLEDPTFRLEVGIDLEAYDDAFLGRVTSRHSDTHHPRYWVSGDPADAINRREPVIHLLVHPRHWHTRPMVNARDDVRRAWEGLQYRLSRRSGSPRIRAAARRSVGPSHDQDPDVQPR